MAERSHTGPHACEACRASKVRCHGGGGVSTCSRCESMSMTCRYPSSRRGRPRGSRNSVNRASVRRSVRESTPPFSIGAAPTVPLSSSRSTQAQASPLDHINAQPFDSLQDQFPVEMDRDEGCSSPSHQAGRRTNELSKHFRSANKAIFDLAVEDAPGPSRFRHTPLAIPGVDLPSEDELLLSKWTAKRLDDVAKYQRRWYQHGLYVTKRDVVPSLFPEENGLVTSARTSELFLAYWTHIHPFCSILDRTLHTPKFVRSRSALLFTVILLTGAIVLATQQPSPEGNAEVQALHAHTEKLSLVVYATHAKSVEIVQAMLIWHDNPLAHRSPLDDDRITRQAALNRMAVEVGLNLPRKTASDHRRDRLLTRNDVRLRAWLMIVDTRFAVFHEKSLSEVVSELDSKERAELESITAYDPDASLSAFYSLMMFSRRMIKRISQAELCEDRDDALTAEQSLVDSFISRWVDDWAPKDGDPTHNFIFRHEAQAAKLLLHVRILSRRIAPTASELARYQAQILDLVHELFDQALTQPQIPHLTFKTAFIVYAAGIIFRLNGRKDVVLRLALRMAGNPDNPSPRTFTVHNGQQMLSMLISSLGPVRSNHKATTTASTSNVLQENGHPANLNVDGEDATGHIEVNMPSDQDTTDLGIFLPPPMLDGAGPDESYLDAMAGGFGTGFNEYYQPFFSNGMQDPQTWAENSAEYTNHDPSPSTPTYPFDVSPLIAPENMSSDRLGDLRGIARTIALGTGQMTTQNEPTESNILEALLQMIGPSG